MTVTETSEKRRDFFTMVMPKLFIMKAIDSSRAAVERLVRRGATVPDILSCLDELGDELDGVSKSTEGEFLSMGESLQRFYHQAKDISGMASSSASLLSGNEIAGVIEELRSIFVHMERVKGQSEHNTETLRQILATVTLLQNHLDGFDKIIRMLSVLCNSTRIENARLGNRDIGFDALADDVRKLALMIEFKCGELLGRSKSLLDVIQRTLEQVTTIEARQHVQASAVVDSTTASLESLSEKHRLSSSIAEHISHRYGAISNSIGEIVASMQFHDITRQRIEHAREALDSLRGAERTTEKAMGLGGNGRKKLAKRHKDTLALACDVCGLQSAQLQHAKKELLAAVGNIIANLSDIASHIDEMSEESKRMVGVAGDEDHSFFTEIQAGVASATAALTGYSEASSQMATAMGSAGSTLGDMSAFANDIEGIGNKIKLIALNAIVKASHLGEEGAGLGVLSESIHHLSLETCLLTNSVCEALRSIIASAESLSIGGRAESGARHTEIDQMHHSLNSLLDSIRDVNGKISSLLNRMYKEGGELSQHVARTVSEINVHERVDAVISRVVSRLDELVDAYAPLKTDLGSPDADDRLKALHVSYTMEGEREIHQAMFGSASQPKVSESTPRAAATKEAREMPDIESARESDAVEDDLGDNVELF